MYQMCIVHCTVVRLLRSLSVSLDESIGTGEVSFSVLQVLTIRRLSEFLGLIFGMQSRESCLACRTLLPIHHLRHILTSTHHLFLLAILLLSPEML